MGGVHIAGDGILGGCGFFVLIAAKESLPVGLAVRRFAADEVEAGAQAQGQQEGLDRFHLHLRKNSLAAALQRTSQFDSRPIWMS